MQFIYSLSKSFTRKEKRLHQATLLEEAKHVCRVHWTNAQPRATADLAKARKDTKWLSKEVSVASTFVRLIESIE
jgi:hypothetical protein